MGILSDPYCLKTGESDQRRKGATDYAEPYHNLSRLQLPDPATRRHLDRSRCGCIRWRDAANLQRMQFVKGEPMKTIFSAMLLLTFWAMHAQTQNNANQPPAQPLWPNGAPGNKGAQPEDVPSFQHYPAPADKVTGAAIVVCPGGGYGHVLSDAQDRTNEVGRVQ